MPDPGDVVTVDFPGATGIKRRPAVVVSTDTYHAHRPDRVLALLTTQTASSTTPVDYVLQDWAAAGLRQASAFRCYFTMKLPAQVNRIGRLTERDWQAVQQRLAAALSVPKLVP